MERSIILKDVTIYTSLGWFEKEHHIINPYTINATIGFSEDESIKHLNQTIDYVTVFEIIKRILTNNGLLLETLLEEMVTEIAKLDNRITSIFIEIIKDNPLISNFEGKVGASILKKL